MLYVKAFAAGLLMLATVVHASDEDDWNKPAPPWEGVWQGTIGTLPVHVCLDATPYQKKGVYYYDRTRRLIQLSAGDKDGLWSEGEENAKGAPLLQLAVQGPELSGSWSNAGKQLPIRLRRIGGPSSDFEGPCSSMTFQAGRVAPPQIISKTRTFDGVAITSLSFKPPAWFENVSIGTFVLDRPGPAAARINAELRSVLPKPDGTGEWLECMAGNANANGADGDYSAELTPRMITRRWLVINDHWDGYCGGAHPDSSNHPRIFDLSSGREVSLYDWFNAKALKRERVEGEKDAIVTITPAFRSLVIGSWKAEDSECADPIKQEEFWDVELTRTGFTFTPQLGHAVMACTEDFKVPFGRVAPYLSPEGTREIAALRAEVEHKP